MLEKQYVMILAFLTFTLLKPLKAEKGSVACLPIPCKLALAGESRKVTKSYHPLLFLSNPEGLVIGRALRTFLDNSYPSVARPIEFASLILFIKACFARLPSGNELKCSSIARQCRPYFTV